MAAFVFVLLIQFYSCQLTTSSEFNDIQNNWMEEILSNPDLCDAHFIVGKEKRKMYGIAALLSNISPILKQQLSENINLYNNECISLDFNPDIFEIILRISFGLQPDINNENIAQLIEISQLLEIYELERECNRYLIINNNRNIVQHIIVPELLTISGVFSHSSIYNNIIWISGTIGAYNDKNDNNKAKLINGGIQKQTKYILESIDKILFKSGSSFKYVTNLKIFIANNSPNRYKLMNEAYVRFFNERNLNVCSRITVGVQNLALGADVEIDGSAVIPN